MAEAPSLVAKPPAELIACIAAHLAAVLAWPDPGAPFVGGATLSVGEIERREEGAAESVTAVATERVTKRVRERVRELVTESVTESVTEVATPPSGGISHEGVAGDEAEEWRQRMQRVAASGCDSCWPMRQPVGEDHSTPTRFDTGGGAASGGGELAMKGTPLAPPTPNGAADGEAGAPSGVQHAPAAYAQEVRGVFVGYHHV